MGAPVDLGCQVNCSGTRRCYALRQGDGPNSVRLAALLSLGGSYVASTVDVA